jgi:transcriptional regulator with XRE-family HTH domain
MKKNEAFGKRLRRERLAGNLGLRELGRMAGISGEQVGNLESGKSVSPRISTVEKLARALKCDPEWLAGWSK